MLLLDGATRQTTLFLPPKNEARERAEGPLLVPDDYARQVTGIARIRLDRHSGERRRFDKAAVKAMRSVRDSTQCVALPWDRHLPREQRESTMLRARRRRVIEQQW